MRKLIPLPVNSFAFGFLETFSIASRPPEFDPFWTQQITLLISASLMVAIANIPTGSAILAGGLVSASAAEAFSKMGALPGYVMEGLHIALQAKSVISYFMLVPFNPADGCERQKSWSPVADFGVVVGTICDAARQSIFESGQSLLQGRPDSSGRGIAEVIGNGYGLRLWIE